MTSYTRRQQVQRVIDRSRDILYVSLIAGVMFSRREASAKALNPEYEQRYEIRGLSSAEEISHLERNLPEFNWEDNFTNKSTTVRIMVLIPFG